MLLITGALPLSAGNKLIRSLLLLLVISACDQYSAEALPTLLQTAHADRVVGDSVLSVEKEGIFFLFLFAEPGQLIPPQKSMGFRRKFEK